MKSSPSTRRTTARGPLSGRETEVDDVVIRNRLEEPGLAAAVGKRPNRDVYASVTARIVALLEEGTIPWRRPWARIAPQNLISRKAYRGINPFLLACAGYGSPYWLTFRQAKELGGHVRRGERATRVVFWKLYERQTGTEDEEVEKIPVLRSYSVFNVEQCDGIPSSRLPLIETEEFEPIDEAERIVRDMPSPPSITHGATGAFYRPASDTIHMPKPGYFQPREAYYATLFHELTHSTGHAARLRRKLSETIPRFGSPDYSEEELVAEMGAAFLCGHTGIMQATVENSAAYIQGWLQRLNDDHRLVVMAAAKAQKAADYILGPSTCP